MNTPAIIDTPPPCTHVIGPYYCTPTYELKGHNKLSLHVSRKVTKLSYIVHGEIILVIGPLRCTAMFSSLFVFSHLYIKCICQSQPQ